MKKFTSMLLVISLLLLTFGVIPVEASGQQAREFHSLGKAAAGKAAADFVPDEILVKFKNDSKPFRVVKVPAGRVPEKVQEYIHRPDVLYAEPNYYAQALQTPDDPYFNLQWNLRNAPTAATLAAGGGIGMEPAWELSTGTGVTVAIVDTGIAYENYGKYVQAPDLAQTNFVAGYDFVNKDAHANDDNSHGTHVAGTVAQSTGNGRGAAGIAYNAALMPVKVLNKSGSGSYDIIANGIRFAAEHGAEVINLSLGGAYPSTTLEEALAYAHDTWGVTIVAAAGNDGQGSVSYPAAYDDYVIAVGAARLDKELASYSNWGTSLDLVAPGGDMAVDQNGDGYGDGILQNTFNPTSKNTSEFGYWFFQGTSMASPHVAGVAALLIAKEKAAGNAATPEQVASALQETALDLGASGRDDTFGWGLVDACAALNWTAVPNYAPAAAAQTVSLSEDTSLDLTLTGTDRDGDPLTYTIVSGPANGALSGTAPNVIYTPNADYNGSDSFTFRVSDGKVYSDPAAVDITVEPVNDPPTAIAQAVSTEANSATDITLRGTDVDGDALTYEIVSGPANGALTGTAPNLTYTPNTDFTGQDSFTFSVSDGSVSSAPAAVSITVTALSALNILNNANNAGFENGDFSGWDTTGNPAVSSSSAYSGLYGANLYKTVRGEDKNKIVAQTFTFSGNGTAKTCLFTFSAMLQMSTSGTGYMEIVQDGVLKGAISYTGKTWLPQELSRQLTIPAQGTTIIRFQFRVSGSGMYVDDTSVTVN